MGIGLPSFCSNAKWAPKIQHANRRSSAAPTSLLSPCHPPLRLEEELQFVLQYTHDHLRTSLRPSLRCVAFDSAVYHGVARAASSHLQKKTLLIVATLKF